MEIRLFQESYTNIFMKNQLCSLSTSYWLSVYVCMLCSFKTKYFFSQKYIYFL